MAASETLTTIMVLEPDVIARSEISEILRGCGYRIVEGVSAEDARLALRSDARIDLILAQVTLRGSSSGFEFAQELRQTRPEIAVILVSGIAGLVERASALCARGPSGRPRRPEEIIRRIQALLERRGQSGGGSEHSGPGNTGSARRAHDQTDHPAGRAAFHDTLAGGGASAPAGLSRHRGR